MRRASLAIQQLETSTRGTSKAMLGVHIGMAALTAAAVTATQEATAFGKAMAEINTLIPDSKNMDRLTRSVRNLSKEFGTRKLQQAKALYQIISAGATNAAEANFILEQSNILAVGGVTDIAVAADGLTSILNAYGPAATNAADATDAMFVAMRVGKTTIDELSRAVGLVAPLAAEAGVSLDELLASASALTSGGIRTRLAFTGLRQIIASIVKPTTEAREAAEQLGLEFNAFALYEQGLEGFFDTLKQSTGGSVEALAQLFGGVEALVPVLALTGRQSEQFKQNLEAMNEKADEAARAVAIVGESASQSFARFRETSTDVLLQFGQSLLTVIVPALETMTEHMENADLAIVALARGIKDAAKWLSVFAGVGGLAALVIKIGPAIKNIWLANVAVNALGTTAVVAGLNLRSGLLAAILAITRALGPWGIAITVAAGIIGFFTKKAYDQAKALEDARDAVDEYANSLGKIDYTDPKAAKITLQNDVNFWQSRIAQTETQIAALQKIIDDANKEIFTPRPGTEVFGEGGFFSDEYLRQQEDFFENRNRLIEEAKSKQAEYSTQAEAFAANLASAEEALARAKNLVIQADEEAAARRQLLTQQQIREREEQARRELRVRQQLEDKLDALTATSVDDQIRDLARLTEEWKKVFGNIAPAIQAEFDKLENYINVDGVVAEVQKAFNQLQTVDLSKINIDMVNAYDILIAQLKIQKSLVDENSAAYERIEQQIRAIQQAQADVAAQNIIAFPTRNLEIALRDLRQQVAQGLVDPDDWAEGAAVAINAFYDGLNQSLSSADMDRFGHEILSALEDITLDDKLEFPGFNFDAAMADARVQLARGLITKETFAEMEQNAKDAFNNIILAIIDKIDDPNLKVALANILKLDEDVDEKNYRKIALQIERAGRAALQVLQAFDAIDDRTADILEGLTQVAANLGGALSGDLNSIAQVIGGAAQVLTGLFQESEGEKKRREALRDNTKAIQQLRKGINDLSSIQNVAGIDITNTIRAFEYNLARTHEILGVTWRNMLKQDWKGLEYSLNKFGISMEEAQRIIEVLGGTWEKGRKNFEEMLKILNEVTLDKVFQDAGSAMDLLRRKIDLFDLAPLDSFDLLRQQFLDLVNLDPATELALSLANIETDIGRQEFVAMLQGIFDQFPNLRFEDLGELTPQQFLDFLQELKNASDAVGEFADDVKGINDSLKNIPEGFKVALKRFEAIDPVAVASAIRPPTPPIQPPNGLEPNIPGGGRGGNTVVVEEGAIVIEGVTDPDEVAEKVLEALKDKSQLLYGETSEWARL